MHLPPRRPPIGFGPLGFLAATQQGIPMTEVLVDKTPLGSFWVRVGVAIAAAPTTTSVAIQLPRLPSGALTMNSDSGAVVYQTAADKSASTATTFVCRATAATNWTALIG